MSPKGNRTGKGGTPKVGGPQSRGSVLKPIRFSFEMVEQIDKKIGPGKSFSDYVRGLCEEDLAFMTESEKKLFNAEVKNPTPERIQNIKKGGAVINRLIKSRKKIAKLISK